MYNLFLDCNPDVLLLIILILLIVNNECCIFMISYPPFHFPIGIFRSFGRSLCLEKSIAMFRSGRYKFDHGFFAGSIIYNIKKVGLVFVADE